jgi:hypothetical protein
MKDVSEHFINPLYYFHLYFVRTSTHVTVLDNIGHPMFSAFPEAAAAPAPPARIRVNGEDQLALDHLRIPHQAHSKRANINWFYNSFGKLEVEGEGEIVPNQSDRTLISNIWNQSGANINLFCREFQVPCELVLAVVSAESGGNAKAYRFEPMERKLMPKAASRPDLLLKYDKMLGTRIASYVPTRSPATKQFGIPPVTKLACQLPPGETVQLTANGKIKNSFTRSVFLVDDIWRPVLEKYATTSSPTATPSVDIKEEQVLQTITIGGGTNWVANRRGRIRVLRAELKKKVSTDDVVVTLTGPNGSASVTIAKNTLTPAVASTGTIDVDAGDTLSLDVQPEGTAMDLKVEWYLGVEGDDGISVPANMWVIPDGGGSAFPNFNPLPDPFSGSVLMRADRSDGPENMTADQVLELIALTGGSILSPGATQTLVSTAFGNLNTVERMVPGRRAALGIPPATSQAQMLSSGWLADARNALFAGIATMRIYYNQKGTQFDLPIVHGWFHGGGPLEPTKEKTRWGVSTPTPTYLDILARRYNAAIDLFLGPGSPTPAPTVRFR